MAHVPPPKRLLDKLTVNQIEAIPTPKGYRKLCKDPEFCKVIKAMCPGDGRKCLVPDEIKCPIVLYGD